MDLVSQKPHIAATPEGGTNVDIDTLRDDVHRAAAYALRTGDWAPHTEACAAFFFARWYAAGRLVLGDA